MLEALYGLYIVLCTIIGAIIYSDNKIDLYEPIAFATCGIWVPFYIIYQVSKKIPCILSFLWGN